MKRSPFVVALLLASALAVVAEERRPRLPSDRSRESADSKRDEGTRAGEPPRVRDAPLRLPDRAPPPTGRMPSLRLPTAKPERAPPGLPAELLEVPLGPPGPQVIQAPPMVLVGFPPGPEGPLVIHAEAIELVGHPPEPGSASTGEGPHVITGEPIVLVGFPPEPSGPVVIEAEPMVLEGFPPGD